MCLLTCKKSTSSPPFFCRYCKDMQTSYFGYFGHACLHTPTIESTCGTLRCLSACQKYISSFTSFLRFYILKNPAVDCSTVFWPTTAEPEFCQIWDWWRNINYNISFHFRLFPGETNDKLFQKIQKNLCWGYFGPFLPKSGQKWIFLEKGLYQFYKYSNYLPSCKKSEKTNELFLRKMPNWQTDGQTDNSYFIGPSVGWGSNKLKGIVNGKTLDINKKKTNFLLV